MPSRSITFAEGEYYHIFNRGVDKRDVYMDKEDLFRFFKCLQVLNTEKAIGSLYEHSFKESLQLGNPIPKLVEIVCYCLNPNHYHLLLKQEVENGISLFMQRLGVAYTNYFNEKYERTGPLFGGAFKAVHIQDNRQLLHLSAYVNLNFEVHDKWKNSKNPLTLSSWGEYEGESKNKICNTSIILEQFSNFNSYKKFARSSLKDIQRRKTDGILQESDLLE